MADNSDNRKKTLLVSVLAFLLIGGSVFLFFVVQGSRDLTGAGNKANFTYGAAAREGAAAFFKFVGFDDSESVAAQYPYKTRPEPDWLKAEKESAAAAAGGAEDVPWSRPPAVGGGSARAVPKMEGVGTSGLGGFGGRGTNSSGGVSRFGEGADAGNVKISAKGADTAENAMTARKSTLNALAKTRSMLGEGLRSGSAMSAKGRWDASFGAGQTGGSGGDLAYSKGGLVGLDKIKKGEVDNLKIDDPRSLKVPEPGAPKEEKGAAEKDPVLQKAKEAVEDTVKKSLAGSVVGALGNGVKNVVSGGGDATENTPSDDGSQQCDMSAGPPTAVCAGLMAKSDSFDKAISYKLAEKTSEGQVLLVDYNGALKGTAGENAGKSIAYTQPARVLLRNDGSIDFTWAEPRTTVAPGGGQ